MRSSTARDLIDAMADMSRHGFDARPASRHCPGPMSIDGFENAQVEIRLDAIVENYRAFQRLAGPAAVGAVVKANAYGTGMNRVAKVLAAQSRCDTFFVARLAEGIALRPLVPSARIFVL